MHPSVWTSMLNLESVVQKTAELPFDAHEPLPLLTPLIFFLLSFVQTVHTNFGAKSGVCSSKNEWVIALGTKEERCVHHLSHYSIYIQAIIQSKLRCSKFKVWTKSTTPAEQQSWSLAKTYFRLNALPMHFFLRLFLKYANLEASKSFFLGHKKSSNSRQRQYLMHYALNLMTLYFLPKVMHFLK